MPSGDGSAQGHCGLVSLVFLGTGYGMGRGGSGQTSHGGRFVAGGRSRQTGTLLLAMVWPLRPACVGGATG